jgi:hypothetical protein
MAKLTYMGVDPKTASPQEIQRILGLGTPPAAPPPANPPAPPPVTDNTDPGLNNPPPPDPGAADPTQPAGKAADAASADGKQVQAILDELAGLDKSSATTLDQIHAAGVEGRKQLDSIQTDVETKIQQLGPQLNTPQGQQQLRDFLKEKLVAAKKIIDQHIADAEDAARKTRDTISKYSDIGGDTKPDSTPDTAADSPPASPPPAATEPAAATPATAPAAAPMMSPTGMPGMPMGGMPAMGGIPMPSFGGGGMPSMGGGDPFSGSQGTPQGQPVGFHDQPADNHTGSDTKPADFHQPADDQTGGPSHNNDSGHSSGSGTQPATSPDAGNAPHTGDAATHDDNKGTDVKLPDGSVAHARNSQEAIAARAAVGGATVADAYKSAGVDLPPPGTPVINPLPPTQLQAGDVGVWRDHVVMALGGGKVLVNGQVQPVDSVGSGPDFLGWIDPTTKGSQPAPPAPPPGIAGGAA